MIGRRGENDKLGKVEGIKGEIKKSQRQGNREVRKAREKDKEAEKESNHLTGLKVSVRLTYSPEAKTMQELVVAVSAGMKDEHSSSSEARDMKSRHGKMGAGAVALACSHPGSSPVT